jgi:pyridoxamine 5'-phosphate oxidase-like protein
MIEVALHKLKAVIEERGAGAYALTVSRDERPHAVYAEVGWDGGRLVVSGIGGTTAANAVARPHISLLFPVKSDADYTLFVDGPAVVESSGQGRRLVVTPVRAVLHRSGPAREPASGCAADCVPILQTPGPVAPPL